MGSLLFFVPRRVERAGASSERRRAKRVLMDTSGRVSSAAPGNEAISRWRGGTPLGATNQLKDSNLPGVFCLPDFHTKIRYC